MLKTEESDQVSLSGKFLVATEKIDENIVYRRSVILPYSVSDKVTAGLIINRTIDEPGLLEGANGDLGKALINEFSSYMFGGPITVLVTAHVIFKSDDGKSPVAGANAIGNGIYVCRVMPSLPTTKKLISSTVSRAYTGVVGWAPGQLEKEIKAGLWTIVDMQPDLIFYEYPESVWETLSGALYKRVSSFGPCCAN